jgi:hypothetical protein
MTKTKESILKKVEKEINRDFPIFQEEKILE